MSWTTGKSHLCFTLLFYELFSQSIHFPFPPSSLRFSRLYLELNLADSRTDSVKRSMYVCWSIQPLLIPGYVYAVFMLAYVPIVDTRFVSLLDSSFMSWERTYRFYPTSGWERTAEEMWESDFVVFFGGKERCCSDGKIAWVARVLVVGTLLGLFDLCVWFVKECGLVEHLWWSG